MGALVALAQGASQHAPVEALTNHERRIFPVLAEGNNAASSARKPGMAPHTWRRHLHHINRTLRTHRRPQAVAPAQQRGPGG